MKFLWLTAKFLPLSTKLLAHFFGFLVWLFQKMPPSLYHQNGNSRSEKGD
jgi:nitrate reductase NapE component